MPNALFHNRFFPREEGGTNVRQVWIEVQLQHALAAKAGHCEQALTLAQHLGTEVPGLAFTRDGLEPILQSARTNYLLGTIYAACSKPDESKARFEAAASASAPDQIRWAWLAAKQLPGLDQAQWQGRLQASFEQAESRSGTSAIQVGGCTPRVRWRGTLATTRRRARGSVMRCCCLTACWRITSPAWPRQKLRGDHFDLRFSEGLDKFGGGPSVRDESVNAG